jgi:two-component system sensor kinase FixL
MEVHVWPVAEDHDRLDVRMGVPVSEPPAQQPRSDSDERWRALLESAVDGIVVIDARGRIEVFNRSAERLFGYREADLVGQNVSVLMPSPYREEHDGYLARYQSTNEPHIIGIGREVQGRHRDGTTFPIHLSVGEMRLAGARKFTGIIHDLRPRMRLEEKLREQATMVRLGEMAAVVAHEVKNPLAAIRGAIQVLSTRMPEGGRDAAVAQQVVQRIDGLTELVEDLLIFARPPQPRLTRSDLAALARSAGELLARDPMMANVHITYAGEAPHVMADPEQLQIVIGNLLVNSAQAMQGQGTIAVAAEARGGFSRLTVRDGGPGIPPDIRDKVFTPFFTTKARGTGLGLPTAKQLVEAQGGTLELICPDEGGTLVTITFPALMPAE